TARQRTQGRPQDLHQAETPAASLGYVFLHALRREAEAQPLIEVNRPPACVIELKGEQKILGDAVGRKAAAILQRACADDRGCPATKGRPPGVLRGHHMIKEE